MLQRMEKKVHFSVLTFKASAFRVDPVRVNTEFFLSEYSYVYLLACPCYIRVNTVVCRFNIVEFKGLFNPLKRTNYEPIHFA
jgi:hypothetical protein